MVSKPKPLQGRDNLYFGAFLGLVLPVVGFLLYYVFFFSEHMSLAEYWDFLFTSGNIAGALSLSVIMNLPPFFLSIRNNRLETVKGIVGATLFYGLLIVIFKLS